MKKKLTHGGNRDGSGRKQKYNEPTVTIAFRVPASKLDQVKELVATFLIKQVDSKTSCSIDLL